MNYVRQTLQDAAIGVGVADTPEGLSAFNRPGSAAAIWRRQIASDFQTWMDGLDADCLPRARVILRPSDAPVVLASLCDQAKVPKGAFQEQFINDVSALVDVFSDLVGARYLRLRLDVITTNACRKFHIDAVHSRLICTYRGTGTQYGVSVDGNQPKRVFTVPTGAPIVLKGTLYPEAPSSGLLHRSPPIEGSGMTRLVLVLDPVNDPGEETLEHQA